MIYFYVIAGLAVSLPFCMIVFGFLMSITKGSKGGVTARYNIAYALDTLAASCCLFGHKTTISGWAGYRKETSNKKRWSLLVKFIDGLPWFYDGHCADAAKNEAIHRAVTL
jgi:hypothetical protein